MAETSYDLATIRDLVARRLGVRRIQDMQMAPKDPDRFDKYVAVRRERAAYADPVILPLGERLAVVARDGEPLVLCDCGHDLGDYRENWKLHADVLVRASDEAFTELWGADHGYDPRLVEIREFVCPGCGALLDVEAVPPTTPVIFDMLPDIDAFYREWLGREPPLPDLRAEDRSRRVVNTWAAEAR